LLILRDNQFPAGSQLANHLREMRLDFFNGDGLHGRPHGNQRLLISLYQRRISCRHSNPALPEANCAEGGIRDDPVPLLVL
jgi:hypothetical protein